MAAWSLEKTSVGARPNTSWLVTRRPKRHGRRGCSRCPEPEACCWAAYGSASRLGGVHARIAAYLTERSQRTAIAQYVARLAAQAELMGVDLASPGDLRVH